MALVDPRPYDEQLHGSIEMIEDSSQIPLVQSQERPEKHGKAQVTSTKKEDIVLVTVKPLTTSSSSSQSDVTQEREEGQQTASTENDQEPILDPEASRRRYSVMMASLAAARVEESKAALLAMQSRSHPSNSTGVPSETAIDGWKWQTRRELEDDFAMREKYFADEL